MKINLSGVCGTGLQWLPRMAPQNGSPEWLPQLMVADTIRRTPGLSVPSRGEMVIVDGTAGIVVIQPDTG